jgi:glycerol kinase
LREAGHEALIRERTGLIIDPYFSATKLEWLLDNVDGLRERARDGRAVFGTVDSWVLFKLTGEHATEVSNASRTLLCDLRTCAWATSHAAPCRRSARRSGSWGAPARARCRASTAFP